jgi:hypothetical protein
MMVKCIDDRTSAGNLITGDFYPVELTTVSQYDYKLVGIDGWWIANRFEVCPAVRCIDAVGSSSLHVGGIYYIKDEHIQHKDWFLIGQIASWLKVRFEPVIQVRCINTATFATGLGVVAGGIYNVKSDEGSHWKFESISGVTFDKSSFVEIVSTLTYGHGLTAATAAVTATPVKPKRNPNEECPCHVGLKVSQCDFHKGT